MARRRRKHIPLQTQLAAALIQILAIPHEHAKAMSAKQIISLANLDHHPIRHEAGGVDEPWNLQWLSIMEHREKTAKVDVPEAERARRLRENLAEHHRVMAAKGIPTDKLLLGGDCPAPDRSKRPKRKITPRAAPWPPKGSRPLRSQR